MAMLKSGREPLVATLFFEIPMADPRKSIIRDRFWPPVCLPGTEKGPETRFGNRTRVPRDPKCTRRSPRGVLGGVPRTSLGAAGTLKSLVLCKGNPSFSIYGTLRVRDGPGTSPGRAPVASVSDFTPRPPPPKPLKRTS